MSKDKLYGYLIALVLSAIFITFVGVKAHEISTGVQKSLTIQDK